MAECHARSVDQAYWDYFYAAQTPRGPLARPLLALRLSWAISG
jgi:hypothetical protein